MAARFDGIDANNVLFLVRFVQRLVQRLSHDPQAKGSFCIDTSCVS